jgi:DNA polymerase-4
MDRHIAFFQIPSFEIALVRRQESALRSRPIAIGTLQSARACLREVSQEAYEDGVRPGMSAELARRLCPRVQIVPPDPIRVDPAHHRLQRIMAEYAPVWEPVCPGHVFLDLTGTQRLFGPAVDTAMRIEREVIRREHLTGVLGVGTNKLVSRVATTIVQPPQLCEVRPGLEPNFMAPLSIFSIHNVNSILPDLSLSILEDLNLRTLGHIADTPLSHLQLVLGPSAATLHGWARGIDASPVLPTVQQPCLEESISISPDEIDDERLLGFLYRLLEQLCRTLRTQHRVCRRLRLTVRHSDHVEASKHRLLDPGTWWEWEIFVHLRPLFFHCFRRRVRLRTMTVRLDHLESPAAQWGAQLPLFDAERSSALAQRARAERLTLALDRVRDRFGAHAIQRGRTFSCTKKG